MSIETVGRRFDAGFTPVQRFWRFVVWVAVVGGLLGLFVWWVVADERKVDSFADRCFRQGGYVSYYAGDQVWCRKRPDDVLDVRR